jgi:CubicO group peptidase (beta-lactamase class C family)
MSLFVDDNQNFSHIKWDTLISELIRDDFVLNNDYATTHITIEDALSHRSGMPRHDLSYGGYIDGHKFMPKDLVRSLRHLPLTAEPRTKFQYCNLMFVVVSHVIETLSGTWLGDFLKGRIWTPLNMHSTVSLLYIQRNRKLLPVETKLLHSTSTTKMPRKRPSTLQRGTSITTKSSKKCPILTLMS